MMQPRRLPNGNLLVPMCAESEGVVGDAMIEIGPDDPEYARWEAELNLRDRLTWKEGDVTIRPATPEEANWAAERRAERERARFTDPHPTMLALQELSWARIAEEERAREAGEEPDPEPDPEWLLSTSDRGEICARCGEDFHHGWVFYDAQTLIGTCSVCLPCSHLPSVQMVSNGTWIEGKAGVDWFEIGIPDGGA